MDLGEMLWTAPAETFFEWARLFGYRSNSVLVDVKRRGLRNREHRRWNDYRRFTRRNRRVQFRKLAEKRHQRAKSMEGEW